MQHALVRGKTGWIEDWVSEVCPHQHVCRIQSKCHIALSSETYSNLSIASMSLARSRLAARVLF